MPVACRPTTQLERAYVNEETSCPPGVCRRVRARGDRTGFPGLAAAPGDRIRARSRSLVDADRGRRYRAHIEKRTVRQRDRKSVV